MENRFDLMEMTADVQNIGFMAPNLDQEEAEDQAQAFVIDDDKKASWALKKYKLLEIEEDRKAKLVKDEIDRLKLWLENEQGKIDKKKAGLEQMLGAYLMDLRKADPKAKVDTPYGTVSTRKNPDKWTYEDQAVIKFLHEAEMDEFIRVKEEIDKTPLKKALRVLDGKAYTEAGEEVKGISVESNGEKIVIKAE